MSALSGTVRGSGHDAVMKLRELTTIAAANQFLREHYISEFNQRFTVKATERGTAFLRLKRSDLELVFSLHHKHTVNRDNTVNLVNWDLRHTA